jgi:hypothetical protein
MSVHEPQAPKLLISKEGAINQVDPVEATVILWNEFDSKIGSISDEYSTL